VGHERLVGDTGGRPLVPALPPDRIVPRTRRASVLARVRRAWVVYLFLLPTLLLLLGMKYLPAGLAMGYSFFDWNGVQSGRFVGLDNYLRLASDPVFLGSLANLLVYTAGIVALTIVPPFIAAELLLDVRSSRLQYAFRALFVVPLVVPSIVVLLIWRFFFNPLAGVLNQLLEPLGVPPLAWLTDPHIALGSVLLVGFPWVGGVAFLIFLAGLQSIPKDLWDAVELDGPGRLRRIVTFDLPLILGEVRVLVVLGILGAIQGFGVIMVLTFGGPGYSTMVPGLYMYLQAFGGGARFGYATAIGVVLFVIIAALTGVTLRTIRSSTAYDPTSR
jgi:raffinose/stachyose/melibiose transport system permease protein